MTTHPIIKFIISLGAGILAILEPAIPFVLISFAFILWDCWTAFKLSKRIKLTNGLSTAKFQSRKAEKIIETSTNALIFIVLAMFVNDNVTKHYGNLYLPNIASAIVIGVQLVSVLENISSCNDERWARWLQMIFTDKSTRHYDINNEECMENKSIWGKFTAPTPKKWKQIRNTAASILAALGTIGGISASVPNSLAPAWFPTVSWYAGTLLVLIIAFAQSREEK